MESSYLEGVTGIGGEGWEAKVCKREFLYFEWSAGVSMSCTPEWRNRIYEKSRGCVSDVELRGDSENPD